MKIGFFGDGRWARMALEKFLSDSSIKVRFLTPRWARPDEELCGIAELGQVSILRMANVNAADSLDKIAEYGCDLLVSLSFNQIFKKEILELTELGIINCHAGALPYYRGRNILNWALINGEREFGVTVHYVDLGIDTGDILLQEMIPILPEDDYCSILAKAEEECANLLYSCIKNFQRGPVTSKKQSSIHPVGFYCGGRIPGDEFINWSSSSVQIHNFIRALVPPGPGALALVGGKRIAILKSKLIEGAINFIGTCGEVIGRQDDGITVKTGDSSLLIEKVAEVSDSGMFSHKQIPRFRIGTRFDINPKMSTGREISPAGG